MTELEHGALPPHSLEAEQSVLGALLLSNTALDRIEDKVAAADFYTDAHRSIYRALRSEILAGKAADVVTISAALTSAGDLARVGGMAYLGSLVQNVPTAANVEHYADIVRDRALRRAIMAFAMAASELAHSRGGANARELLEQVQRQALGIDTAYAGPDAIMLGELVPKVVEEVERRAAEGTPPGLKTGLVDLDRQLVGLLAGDLVVLGARPSMGKTSLALQIADAAAIEGLPALVFSLEMAPEKLVERQLAHVSRVNSHAIRSGRLNSDDWERIAAGIRKLTALPLYLDGSPRLTIDRIRSRALQLQRRRGLGLVVVDYVQLMDGDGENRNAAISAISRGLKLLAGELRVPVIALSQLNRGLESRPDKRPMLSDLRESGSLEQDADVVLFLYRDEVYHPDASEAKGVAEILIAKNRDGPTGRVYTTFLGQFNRFEDCAWRPTTAPRAPAKRRKVEDEEDEVKA